MMSLSFAALKRQNPSHLLHVSVRGLPHVVVLYDTSQRLPRQLHGGRDEEERGGRQGEQTGVINVSGSYLLGVVRLCSLSHGGFTL